jgi:hypothetical protein
MWCATNCGVIGRGDVQGANGMKGAEKEQAIRGGGGIKSATCLGQKKGSGSFNEPQK